MSEKESVTNNKETPSEASVGKKQQRRYSKENKKVTLPLNEEVTGPRTPLGKKQRRQHKLDPNRG